MSDLIPQQVNEPPHDQLEEHIKTLPIVGDKKLVYKAGDANGFLLEISAALKKRSPSYTALIFLDPFGMQINGRSIASLKGTRSDIWILVPTGVIVNRLWDRSGHLKHIEKLESFFGMTAKATAWHNQA